MSLRFLVSSGQRGLTVACCWALWGHVIGSGVRWWNLVGLGTRVFFYVLLNLGSLRIARGVSEDLFRCRSVEVLSAQASPNRGNLPPIYIVLQYSIPTVLLKIKLNRQGM